MISIDHSVIKRYYPVSLMLRIIGNIKKTVSMIKRHLNNTVFFAAFHMPLTPLEQLSGVKLLCPFYHLVQERKSDYYSTTY